MVTRSNYALRLSASLKAEAARVAAAEGTTLNTLINIALAEKLSALETAEYFAARASRGNVERAREILAKAGKGGKVRKGDEVE